MTVRQGGSEPAEELKLGEKAALRTGQMYAGVCAATVELFTFRIIWRNGLTFWDIANSLPTGELDERTDTALISVP